jgi:DNA polymerase V
MIGAGIHHGDTLVVDRALVPADKQVVVAVVDGEFTVKRLRAYSNRLVLAAEKPQIPPLEITAAMDFQIWGVVTFVLHKLR